ncbi:MAG: PEP-CTERM sorting domain-containing protein [Verrucomicrobia bacterium]|nr:PEP-CTERM sorting domain-containing protein [Verrucomicrobiota bacterium]
MKKVALLIAVMMMGITASATVDMWQYAIQLSTAPQLGSQPGAGAGWYVGLFNNAGDVLLGSTTVAANNAGTLYVLGWTTPLINEGTTAYMSIFNNTTAGAASYKIKSATVVLQDLTAPWSPPAANVNVSFSGQSWQAVPEPATFLLFGIGGIGAWLVRRNKRMEA